MQVIELQGAANVRDVGGTPVQGGRAVAPGLFYRGSALANVTPDDCALLFDTLSIRCVIDVRTGWEREAKPDVVVPGVDNLHIPFYDLKIVGLEYTEPAAGTKVVGRDVACEPRSFYYSLANELTVRQMRQGVTIAFENAMQGKPVYMHCSGGKDRAGVLMLLVLTVLGASRDDILQDYLFTNVSRDAKYEQTFARFLKLAGGDEQRAHELVLGHRALPENLERFYTAIDESYGSMDGFIRNQLGISDERRAAIRERCTI